MISDNVRWEKNLSDMIEWDHMISDKMKSYSIGWYIIGFVWKKWYQTNLNEIKSNWIGSGKIIH